MVDIYYRDDYCNSYLIYNDKLEAILVDPGYDGEKLIEHINKLNLVDFDRIEGLRKTK